MSYCAGGQAREKDRIWMHKLTNSKVGVVWLRYVERGNDGGTLLGLYQRQVRF